MKPYIILFLCSLFMLSCKSNNAKEKPILSSKSELEKYTFLQDLDGNEVDISEYKGKKVLLNFWATWCAPCRKEMPDLLKAQEKLMSENFVFLLISDESFDEISEFKNMTKYDFNFLKSKRSFNTQGIYVLPTTYVFDETGAISEKIKGVVQWNSEEMIHKLKSI